MGKELSLELLEKEYSVYNLSAEAKIDESFFGNDFVSVTKTKDELSVVAVSGTIEHFDKKEDCWRILKINGMLDFTLIGIISKISAILANAGISVFVISTYNTDYIMVKTDKLDEAVKVLEQNNYKIKNPAEKAGL